MDCWKKSFRKLATISSEAPERFDFTREMEATYSGFKVTPATASPEGRRLFFRGHKTVDDIFALAHKPGFEPFVDGWVADPENTHPLDYGVGCGESCEVGADDRFSVEEDYDQLI